MNRSERKRSRRCRVKEIRDILVGTYAEIWPAKVGRRKGRGALWQGQWQTAIPVPSTCANVVRDVVIAFRATCIHVEGLPTLSALAGNRLTAGDKRLGYK